MAKHQESHLETEEYGELDGENYNSGDRTSQTPISPSRTDVTPISASVSHMDQSYENFLNYSMNKQMTKQDRKKFSIEIANNLSDEDIAFEDNQKQYSSRFSKMQTVPNLDAGYDGSKQFRQMRVRSMISDNSKSNPVSADHEYMQT